MSFFGIEAITSEDSMYRGSRFSEVRDAVFENPYQKIWESAGEALPVYSVSLRSVLAGVFRRRYPFLSAARRAVAAHSDLRWGPDHKGFRRLLHPNGICLFGTWEITEETEYSGYFRKGARALLIARYSTCCSETRRGFARSLALVGKLFPSVDRNHKEPLVTANFITQQDIGGDYSDSINDAELLNAPNTTAIRRGTGVPIILVTAAVLRAADRRPTIRQLYQIAELGKAEREPTKSPTFMRLRVAGDQPRIPGERIDFRDEIMAQIYDPGEAQPRRTLKFDIEITDDGETRGLSFAERRSFENWRHIGNIVFNEAVISYNGDFVLHFNHPVWRDDQNNPPASKLS